jgi:putative ABC transport system substrate-binding protein
MPQNHESLPTGGGFIVLLGGAAAAWPMAARAQQGGRVRRVGVVLFSAETDDAALENVKVLREELKKLGWTEGGNLQLDVRFGGGDFNRTRANAAELVNLTPDAILAITGAAVDAARQQTKTIPIVQVAGDSYERGVVQNIAHPEGNITGFSGTFASLGGRWLELLKEAAPNISRVAYLRRPQSESYGRYIEAAAQRLGVKITTIPVSNVAEIRAAIERFANSALASGSVCGCSQQRNADRDEAIRPPPPVRHHRDSGDPLSGLQTVRSVPGRASAYL